MISLLLAEQIGKLLLMMLLGFFLVKGGLLQADGSKPLSVIALYVIMPCVIVESFQVERTREVCQGLLLAAGTAAILHLVLLAMQPFWKKIGLDPVERDSAFYSNAGNLLIPLVVGILGEEWVLYSTAYVCVQTVLLWTHARILMSGETQVEWKKILLNPNVIAVVAGVLLFLLEIRLPGLLVETFESVGDMIGPLNMMVAGILLGGLSLKELRSYKRLPLVVLLRMVICPLILLAVIRILPLTVLAPEGETIVLICFMASITPTAAVITQMAQVFGRDARYAMAINVAGTVVSIVSMPLLVGLYQML